MALRRFLAHAIRSWAAMAALLLVVAPVVSRWVESLPQQMVMEAMCETGHQLATKPATLALGSREGQIQLGKHALPHDAACEHCLLAALLLTPHDWTWRRAAPTHASAGRDVCASNVPRFASSTAHRPRGPPMAA